MMERKSDRVRRLVAEGNYKDALRIASGFRKGISKEDADTMKRGFECMNHSRFYQSIGVDTRQASQQAVDTILRLYGT